MDSEASMFDHLERMLLDENAEPSDMPLSFLRAITNNFSEERELGRGGFAVVYKGLLRNGVVAVKKLSNMIQLSDEMYLREVKSMMRLKHKNIVRFLGYCADTQWKMLKYDGRHVMAEARERLFCLEYMPNSSLDKFISDVSQGLQWRMRYKIIMGICEGLHYLHEENVVHLDLKPANILLDFDLVPKIADFGLSRCFDDNQTRMDTTTILGTMGYMAPEYFGGVFTYKSDVYSLGVIIIEMLTGKKGYCDIEYVLKSWEKRFKTPMGDTLSQIKVCVEIGLRCIEVNPHNRPDLRQIIEVLNEGSISVIPETTTSSSLVTQESDEHVSEDKNVAAITDEKQQKVSLLSTLPKNLPFNFLEEITDGFSKVREIGRGAFGVVYKGLLVDGHSVAVRRLLRFQGLQMKQFANEVNILMELRHKNIVNLLGYCSEVTCTLVKYQGKFVQAETYEQLLCYEYLDYGSIDKYIFGYERDWRMCFKMIKGICEGLCYLHEENDRAPIIHLNLKPANVLLDADMEPRITDFGLSRLVAEDNTRTVTTHLGAIGYMAPEYLHKGAVTRKADIFSLGILILEIVTGEQNSTKVDFIEHVRENCKGEQIVYMYPSLEPKIHDQVQLCIEIGLECVQTDPTKRPTAGDILRKLEEGNKLGPTPFRENITTEIGKPQLFSFDFLDDITNSFNSVHLRGEGGFGCVYEGTPHGDMGVMAVKRFNKEKIRTSPKQFENEVHNLSRIEHKNIVRLIGYCDEIREVLSYRKNKKNDDQPVREYIQERLLCYEYMPKGSLEKIIYGKLDCWRTRYKIIKGICEGLHCLHEGQQDIQIVHLDLKPANILLDSDMVPKLADFGMSRFFSLEQVYIIASRQAMGTIGYIAPEYLEHKKVSTKADIYSLGIIVLEIVTQKACPHSFNADINAQHFINHVRQNLTKDDNIKSMYPDLEADCLQQVKLCIEIGLKCMEKDPTKRPTAGEIISMLEQKTDSNRSGVSNCIVNVIEACISRLPWHP